MEKSCAIRTVARIRQRPRHDHAHGVIEIAALHLVEDGNGTNIRGRRRLVGALIIGVRQRGIRSILDRESYSVSGALKPPLASSKNGFFPSFFQRLTGL